MQIQSQSNATSLHYVTFIHLLLNVIPWSRCCCFAKSDIATFFSSFVKIMDLSLRFLHQQLQTDLGDTLRPVTIQSSGTNPSTIHQGRWSTKASDMRTLPKLRHHQCFTTILSARALQSCFNNFTTKGWNGFLRSTFDFQILTYKTLSVLRTKRVSNIEADESTNTFTPTESPPSKSSLI